VHHVVAQVGQLLRELQLGLAAAQPLVGLLARRDVADEADEARRIDSPHVAHGKIAREDTAVLALRPDFAAGADDPRLAGGHVPVHVTVVLAPVRVGHQLANVAADDLGGRVAEQLLRCAAELLDRAVVVDDDDRVHGRVEQSTELQLLVGTRSAR